MPKTVSGLFFSLWGFYDCSFVSLPFSKSAWLLIQLVWNYNECENFWVTCFPGAGYWKGGRPGPSWRLKDGFQRRGRSTFMSLDTCMLSKGSEGKEVESMIYIRVLQTLKRCFLKMLEDKLVSLSGKFNSHEGMGKEGYHPDMKMGDYQEGSHMVEHDHDQKPNINGQNSMPFQTELSHLQL